MIEFLSTGTLLGLAAGFSPGPLLVLVISETLRHSVKEGVKVSLAPTITDAPILLVALFVLTQLSNFNLVLGIISILGGFFVLYLGYESLRTKGIELNLEEQSSHALKKGVITNALNPHPYIFYMTVGAPLVFKALDENVLNAAAFLGSFLFFLVASKVILALIVGKSKTFLKGTAYINIMRILGVLLILFSIFLFRDGIKLFGMDSYFN
jgi:threonine/homoserine/homoserine lactone efflux protein